MTHSTQISSSEDADHLQTEAPDATQPAVDAAPQDETATEHPVEHPDRQDSEQASAEVDGDDDPADNSAAGNNQPGNRVRVLEREGEIAADFLETLMDIADLDGDLEVDVEGDRAAVAIVDSDEGSVPRRLVGPGASVLEALQELTRLAVQAETGERSRLMLDVAGYRADRRSHLVDLAQRLISEVTQSGQRRELEPMSAFERKIIHDQVHEAGLSSESEGEEPQRYVVILPN